VTTLLEVHARMHQRAPLGDEQVYAPHLLGG